MKKPTITIGIPTYVGGPALVQAVQSIRSAKSAETCRLIVTVDGRPLEKQIAQELRAMSAEIVHNELRGGEVVRTKQLISMAKTDILILTQDDIRFTKDTVSRLVDMFNRNPQMTMTAARILPEVATTLLERVIEAGVRLIQRIGSMWNGGDNYLLANGRCLGFRTSFVKKYMIPDAMINSDAFYYFENARNCGTFLPAHDAIVYNKSPQKIVEHLKQSRKFQLSHEELSHYLPLSYDKHYQIPRGITLRAYAAELMKNPLYMTLYILLFVYTRVAGKNMFTPAQRFWETDESTKRTVHAKS